MQEPTLCMHGIKQYAKCKMYSNALPQVREKQDMHFLLPHPFFLTISIISLYFIVCSKTENDLYHMYFID